MEKLTHGRLVISCVVVFLGLVAFSCCVAAEFSKTEAEDMKLHGNLCSLPTSSAYGLGITAAVCLSIAQIIGTTATGSRFCSRDNKSGTAAATASGRNPTVAITLLVLSWVSFGLAMILLGTGSSMNKGQPYGEGWLDGNCYVVNNGVYIGAATLVMATVVFILGFIYAIRTRVRQTGPDEERRDHEHK